MNIIISNTSFFYPSEKKIKKHVHLIGTDDRIIVIDTGTDYSQYVKDIFGNVGEVVGLFGDVTGVIGEIGSNVIGDKLAQRMKRFNDLIMGNREQKNLDKLSDYVKNSKKAKSIFLDEIITFQYKTGMLVSKLNTIRLNTDRASYEFHSLSKESVLEIKSFLQTVSGSTAISRKLF